MVFNTQAPEQSFNASNVWTSTSILPIICQGARLLLNTSLRRGHLQRVSQGWCWFLCTLRVRELSGEGVTSVSLGYSGEADFCYCSPALCDCCCVQHFCWVLLSSSMLNCFLWKLVMWRNKTGIRNFVFLFYWWRRRLGELSESPPLSCKTRTKPRGCISASYVPIQIRLLAPGMFLSLVFFVFSLEGFSPSFLHLLIYMYNQ